MFPLDVHAHQGELTPDVIRIVGNPNRVAAAKKMILERLVKIGAKRSEDCDLRIVVLHLRKQKSAMMWMWRKITSG